MNITRIRTILLHTWYHFLHSMETWVDVFWFSIIDVIIFGLISLFFIKETGSSRVEFIMLGIIMWEVIRVAQYSVAIGALWEIWSKSFSTLFVSPLTLKEFLFGQIISACVKSLVTFFLTAFLAFVIYHFFIGRLGLMLILYLFELMVFGWAAGIFILGIILRFGTDIQSLAWGLIFFVQPFGAVFYPVKVLPQSVQWFAYMIPVTYIMESMRSQLASGLIEWSFIAIATVLNIFYFLLSYWFLNRMFSISKKTGAFARMEG